MLNQGSSEILIQSTTCKLQRFIMQVGCVMLENEGELFGALSPARAEAWCNERNVPFITGAMIVDAVKSQAK